MYQIGNIRHNYFHVCHVLMDFGLKKLNDCMSRIRFRQVLERTLSKRLLYNLFDIHILLLDL